jgi:hypothetical protein
MVLQELQPFGQQCSRDAGSSLPDLPESLAAVEKVAHDDECPAFRQELRAASDGTELAIALHWDTVSPPRRGINFRF